MRFLNPTPTMPLASTARAFGTPGGGGSLGFADPDARAGYAYAMNQLGFYMPVVPRRLAIRSAFFACIEGSPQHS
jgi:CubicO group peptidase (beta-lactamase class C family)